LLPFAFAEVQRGNTGCVFDEPDDREFALPYAFDLEPSFIAVRAIRCFGVLGNDPPSRACRRRRTSRCRRSPCVHCKGSGFSVCRRTAPAELASDVKAIVTTMPPSAKLEGVGKLIERPNSRTRIAGVPSFSPTGARRRQPELSRRSCAKGWHHQRRVRRAESTIVRANWTADPCRVCGCRVWPPMALASSCGKEFSTSERDAQKIQGSK
jgi:hypothetical protein